MKLISTKQAAETTGLDWTAITWNIRNGFLKAERIGRDWLIAVDSLADFIEKRKAGLLNYGKAGRPKKS